ncbi:putative cation-transporting ATPase 13A1 [Tritrichomonas foetus]|uniref:Cation-transporting ATPase 13A1 n=1 Tax=Tritrichomonas foetus TaxID=1144522 RepID=A0A1J4JP95_9EUKA|nr:putative cation-transporting ATPase 13A1 [Tritrichomonas foetus]|eukprot:OHT00953.1 putative cation-transporting ATPase 13A1 [Tritrichomonas foetus]
MVESVFLRRRPIYKRWDIIPFLLIFPMLLSPCVFQIKECWIEEEPDYPSNSTFAFLFDHIDVEKLEPHTITVMLPIILALLQAILLLIPYWNVNIRRKLHFDAATIEHATHVAFYPGKHRGSPGIVPLIREKNKEPYTNFQQKRREWDGTHWRSIKYPSNLKISEYLHSKGLTETEASKRLLYYGQNNYNIPVPSFTEILIDQLRTPLFAFQIFTNLLYLIDDYISTPLMNILMTVFMESATVRNRQSSFLELRGAETPPIALHVKRNGEWKKTTSDLLVPGDLIVLDQETLCPCDIIIVSGRAVMNEAMLTGESTPQVKESCSMLPLEKNLNTATERKCIMYGGTTIEQIIPSEEKGLPAKGVVGVVLATGLGSAQGKLIRTILFSADKFSVESKDTYYVLIFLAIFSLFSAGYFAYYSFNAHTVSTFRTIAQVMLIIATTIPPDISMQLNCTVTTTLLALSKCKIFCTEPYRITFAGTATTCCFDKTGTLTAEEYKLIGVDNMNAPPAPKGAIITGHYFNNKNNMPLEPLMVIGGCHSLVRGKYGQLVGDSLEASALSSMRFKLLNNTVTNSRMKLTIVKTYHFTSELRKMTTICHNEDQNKLYALMKGAPETIKEILDEVPENYDETCRKYTKQGCRVLALAYREVANIDANTPRSTIECHMKFAGFILFSAAIKRGSEDTVVALLKSQHRVIIITGDDPLTACHVAKVLHIAKNPTEIHDLKITDEDGKEIKSDMAKHTLCYTGRALENSTPEEFEFAVKHCNIFARMSPQMKANIITKLNDLGEHTMMCGDGTNDVSALKQADVGLGLVEEEPEQDEETKSIMESLDEKPVANLGAASIAAPFVSKRPTISGIIDIIRFGRSTLTSNQDLFKQFALTSLTFACQLSILYVENVRFGERQNFIFSLFTMVAQFSIAWAIPRRRLSVERPFPNLFNYYFVSSVLLQFFSHMFFMILTHKLVFDSGFKLSKFNFYSKFTPNLLNTAMYIFKSEIEINTILCNFRGAPFMQSFSENKSLLLGTFLSALIMVIMLADFNPQITNLFQLVSFPSKSFQFHMAMYCILDFVISLMSEKISLYIFSKINQKRFEGKVDQEIIDDLEDYIEIDDDILPESVHEFGLMEMAKSQMLMQQQIAMKNKEASIREKKKEEVTRKAIEEAKGK